MKNIHILPTDKPSRLSIYDNELSILKFEKFYKGNFEKGIQQPINIYIINDEEIKEGYCVLTKGEVVLRNIKTIEIEMYQDAKKIILTTDQDLIQDGVQAIPDEFLEWFIKNPSYEEVEISKMLQTRHGVGWYDLPNQEEGREVDGIYRKVYKIILPKEQLLLQSSIDGEAILSDKQEDENCVYLGNTNVLQQSDSCEKCGKQMWQHSTPVFKQEIGFKVENGEKKEIFYKKETVEEVFLKTISQKQEMLEEASMNYLGKCIAEGNRFTGYADEDFREGYKFREQQEINLAQGYLVANLKNIEKMKSMFQLEDIRIIANHFYYKGIRKATHPDVKFDFDDFIKTFKKTN